MGKQFGYVRVSSKDQNEIRQLNALAAFGIPETNVYMDKQSGKNFDRPAWKQLAKKLKPGDLLVVKSIDRLGRNYDEILEQWRIVTKEKGAHVVIMGHLLQTWCFRSSPMWLRRSGTISVSGRRRELRRQRRAASSSGSKKSRCRPGLRKCGSYGRRVGSPSGRLPAGWICLIPRFTGAARNNRPNAAESFLFFCFKR